MIYFEPENHSYASIVPDGIDWVSATRLLGFLKQPFDAGPMSEKSAKSRKGKWYGMTPSFIRAAWKAEADRSINLGNFYHDNQEEHLLREEAFVSPDGELLRVYPSPRDEHGRKIAAPQRLAAGAYPEHMVYLKSHGICGQSDLPYVSGNTVSIIDYKTNKEIKTAGYTDWRGNSQKMLGPVSHLDDCNFNHYALQLSLYLYIILRHNLKLLPGELIIHHVRFEEHPFTDQFGFPVHQLDEAGNPIVKEVIPYPVPFLKAEVVAVLHWWERNRAELLRTSGKKS
jgi:hypothetical protein